MNRWLHNLQQVTRRGVLALILLVPESVRAALRENAALTSIYEYFDRSKYDQVHDAESWEAFQEWEKRPKGVPHADYVYYEPTFTEAHRQELEGIEGPLISVLVPVYNTPVEWLAPAVESVRAQWYPHWELVLVDDCSDRAETIAWLDALGALDDPRITVLRLEENRNIAGASNEALAVATGAYVALLDHDDELTPDALFRVWQAIRDEGADFVFSDEDKCDETGRYIEPHHKADYSPELFHSQNYLCHLAVIDRELALAVGGFTPGMDGAQDYDLFLKVAEQAKRIVHVPRVLYHWRKVPGSTAAEFGHKSYAQDAGLRSLEAAVARRGLDATVENGRFGGTYRLRYAIQGEPLVSIVIPFRDKPELLDMCLWSILSKSSWRNFEIIGVSNGSEDVGTFATMEAWRRRDERIRFVDYDAPFNFSAINNFAVNEHVRGEHVLLLNNDIEIITEGWIEALLEYSQQPDIGAVGARLYYPNAKLQHAGVIVGLGGVAGHSHKHWPRAVGGYKYRPHLVQNLSAVTAACLMVEKRIYDEVGGLDEEAFTIAFNDVDFCLRIMAAGYRNVYTPFCEAWHHESVSRGYEDTPEKVARFGGEIERFKERHAAFLERGDPYYNPNLTLAQEDFSLSRHALEQRKAEGTAAGSAAGSAAGPKPAGA